MQHKKEELYFQRGILSVFSVWSSYNSNKLYLRYLSEGGKSHLQWRVLQLCLERQKFKARSTLKSLVPLFFLVAECLMAVTQHCHMSLILAEFGYLALTEWCGEGNQIGQQHQLTCQVSFLQGRTGCIPLLHLIWFVAMLFSALLLITEK